MTRTIFCLFIIAGLAACGGNEHVAVQELVVDPGKADGYSIDSGKPIIRNGLYRVVVTGVVIAPTAPDGSAWDPGGKPDPRACVDSACTNACNDTLSCGPAAAHDPHATQQMTGDRLLSGFDVAVVDADSPGPDAVAARWRSSATRTGVLTFSDEDGSAVTISIAEGASTL